MALFPCDLEQHRYRGRQQTMYAALAIGIETWRRKLRLCGPHFDTLYEDLQSNGYETDDAKLNAEVLSCYVCSERAITERAAFFVTVYGQGSDRRDYWAPVHAGCAPVLASRWGLDADIAATAS